MINTHPGDTYLYIEALCCPVTGRPGDQRPELSHGGPHPCLEGEGRCQRNGWVGRDSLFLGEGWESGSDRSYRECQRDG